LPKILRRFGNPEQEKGAEYQCPFLYLNGSPTRVRTSDLRINSPSLYQLSYRGTVNPVESGSGRRVF
jgi:hypothetical protein